MRRFKRPQETEIVRSGIKVARTCGEETTIIMLTVSEAERDLLDAVAAGAKGYLVKSTPPSLA